MTNVRSEHDTHACPPDTHRCKVERRLVALHAGAPRTHKEIQCAKQTHVLPSAGTECASGESLRSFCETHESENHSKKCAPPWHYCARASVSCPRQRPRRAAAQLPLSCAAAAARGAPARPPERPPHALSISRSDPARPAFHVYTAKEKMHCSCKTAAQSYKHIFFAQVVQ